MNHCVTVPSSPLSIAQGKALVHMVPAAQDNLSWLIEYAPHSVALVDGPSLMPVLDYCHKNELKITHILNTHIHGDHIGVNHGIERAFESHPHCIDENLQVWGAKKTENQIPKLTVGLAEGDRLKLGELSIQVWLTEGHINGHISFICSGNSNPIEYTEGQGIAVFCGDTLFSAGCGRLFDGPAQSMLASLRRLCALPLDTLLFPAHEYTLDNLRFAEFINPKLDAIRTRLNEVESRRQQGRSSLPTTVAIERATNLFATAENLESFIHLRQLKDQAVHRTS